MEDWSNLLNRRDVLVVDCETTGIGWHSEVVEVSAVDTTGEVRLDRLIHPAEGLESESAAKLKASTKARLQLWGAQLYSEVHSEIAGVLEGASIVMSYNAVFDERLLRQTAERHGLRFESLNWRCAMRERAQGTSCVSLKKAVAQEGLLHEQKHRALDDSKLLLELLRVVARSQNA